MIRRILTFLLWIAAGAAFATLLFGPATLTRRAFKLLGGPWETGRSRAKGEKQDIDYHAVGAAVDMNRIRSTIEKLASFGSRVPGTPGERKAYEFVLSQFKEIFGPDRVKDESFPCVVPVDEGAEVIHEPTGRRIRLYGLWPNHVKPNTLPKNGVEGELLYCGKGTYEEFDGLELKGNIVCLDFDCGENYIAARALGAAAIILLDRGTVTNDEATRKVSPYPIDVPRLYAPPEAAKQLLKIAAGNNRRVRAFARMAWREVTVHNIYASLDGTEGTMPTMVTKEGKPKPWKEGRLLLSAHYDSISVVPALAPGAENAVGIAVLLETARQARKFGTKRPVTFLATAAHYQSLSGAADFMRKHYSRDESSFKGWFDLELFRKPERGGVFEPIPFDLWLGLDLTSGSPRFATTCRGAMVAYSPSMIPTSMNVVAKALEGYAEEFWPGEEVCANAVTPYKRTLDDFFGSMTGLDSEMVIAFGQFGATLRTTSDLPVHLDTPHDRPEFLRWGNIERQAVAAAMLLLKTARDEQVSGIRYQLENIAVDFYGTVVWFDPETNPFVPAGRIYRTDESSVPRAAGPPMIVYGLSTSFSGVRGLTCTFAHLPKDAGPKAKEEFFLYGIRNRSGSSRLAGRSMVFYAYGFDEDGNISFVLDRGPQGLPSYPNQHTSGGMQLVLFPCRAVTILDAIDPRYLTGLNQGHVFTPDAAEPINWGMDGPGATYGWYGGISPRSCAMVAYMKPGSRMKFAGATTLLGIKMLLLNSPEKFLEEDTKDIWDEAPRGTGYPVDQPVIFEPAFNAARDMWTVDHMWIRRLAKHNIRSDRLLRLHDHRLLPKRKAMAAAEKVDARRALLAARRARRERRWSDYMRHTRIARSIEACAHPEVLASANDAVKGIVFYFALLIPFAFFAERLLFGFADIRKRIGGFAVCFLSVFFLLQFVHPAFSLATSPYVILLAFVILSLSAITIAIVATKFRHELEKIRQEAHGLHESDVGRLSAAFAAVMLGIANLRRRPLRTGLTALTVTLLMFTVLSMTSVKTTISFFRIATGKIAGYRGALVRNRDLSPLGEHYLPSLQDAFGEVAEILPRWWFYREGGSKYSLELANSNWSRQAPVNAITALDVREIKLLPQIQGALIGDSRWFREGEKGVCLVSNVMAGALGFGPEQLKAEKKPEIVFKGRTLRVIGIFDNERWNRITDLDGEPILPPEPGARSLAFQVAASRGAVVGSEVEFSRDIAQIPRLDSAGVLVVPLADAGALDCRLASVALRCTADDEKFSAAYKQFLARTGTLIFTSERDEKTGDYHVVACSSFGTTNLRGLGNLAVPILIAALIVLNTMMGSVAEREGEIAIYCSVGLSPSHVGALFLAESCVFAVVGAVMGYLLGQLVAGIFVATGWVAGLNLNYSSLSAVVCTIVVMATVFLSTIYPAKRAAGLSVPDVTRKWRFPEPAWDIWTFDFPFTVGAADILGLYTFLLHFFESYGESSIGGFYSEDVRMEPLDGADGRMFRLTLTAWLAPFDLGISQKVNLDAIDTRDHNVYRVEVKIQRLSGDRESWQRMNRGFLNLLRKRFLVWRTVPKGLKEQFAAEGREKLET